MPRKSPSALASDPALREGVIEALGKMLPGVEIGSLIDGIETQTAEDPCTGVLRNQVIVRLSGLKREVLAGQFPPFNGNQMRGFHENYVFGYIHGAFRARYKRDMWSGCDLILDIVPQERLKSDFMTTTFQYISVSAAIKGGMLVRDSPLHSAMDCHGLSYVLIAGTEISGPSTAMIAVVNDVVSKVQPRLVLDLFAGTTALSRVALSAGADRAVAVETNLEERVVHETLGELADRCQLVDGNAAQFSVSRDMELVLADPFYDFTLETVRQLMPKLGKGQTVILNLGRCEPRSWSRLLQRELRNFDATVDVHDTFGELIAVCKF